MAPWGQEPQSRGLAVKAEAWRYWGPWRQEPWDHGGMGWGPWGSRAMEGGWSGGRAEQAERAERAGMHWGPLKSFDKVI